MSTETYEYEKINAKDKPIAEDFVYVYSEIEDGGFRKVSKAMLKVLLGVATKLSELENDKAFITKTVLDLENYYLKSDTYSKDEIDNRISLIPRFDVQVVSSLPTTNISETTVYLVSSGDDSDNLYTEYINVNGLWEILGTQKIASVENAVLYTEQSLTEEQKTQARTNISAASSEEVRQLEDAIADYDTLTLGVNPDDGLIYIYKKGTPIGTGVEQGVGGDVIGVVDSNNNIILTGELADGTYTLKYENKDGTYTEIGAFDVGTVVSYNNILETNGTVELNKRYSASSAGYSACNGMVTLKIPIADVKDKTIYFKGFSNILASSKNSTWYLITSANVENGSLVGDGTSNPWTCSKITTDSNGVSSIPINTTTLPKLNESTVAYLVINMAVSTGAISSLDGFIMTIDEEIA